MRASRCLQIVVVACLCACGNSSQAQTTWHIDDDACPGPHTGLIADPFCSIQTELHVGIRSSWYPELPRKLRSICPPNDVIFVRATIIGVGFQNEDGIAGNHNFGAIQQFDSQNFPGQGITVLVSSGTSGLPGFDWRMTMDFANFDLPSFGRGTFTLQVEDINSPDTISPISEVTVRDADGVPLSPGELVFDFGNIEWNMGVVQLIDGGDVVTIHWAQSCPESCTIIDSNPPKCAVDARQPHERNDAGARQGWDSITFHFDCPTQDVIPTSSSDFTVTSDTRPTPNITLVNANAAGIVQVDFDQPIPPGGWTCVTHNDTSERVCIGSLPADVNGDGKSDRADILGVVDCLNAVATFDCFIWRADMDRSDEAGPADILRLIDLLSGAAAFDTWLRATIGSCP